VTYETLVCVSPFFGLIDLLIRVYELGTAILPHFQKKSPSSSMIYTTRNSSHDLP
jgi:hypothetical protein